MQDPPGRIRRAPTLRCGHAPGTDGLRRDRPPEAAVSARHLAAEASRTLDRARDYLERARLKASSRLAAELDAIGREVADVARLVAGLRGIHPDDLEDEIQKIARELIATLGQVREAWTVASELGHWRVTALLTLAEHDLGDAAELLADLALDLPWEAAE